MSGQEHGAPRALVVGAGIGGLTAAVALRRRGWHVDVQDRGAAPDSRGAALGIWPHAWRGLESVGITPLLTDAYDYRSATIRSRGGRLLGYLPLGQIERRQGAPVRLVGRPLLMEALLEVARELDTRLTFGTAFDAGTDLAAYDVVVGADGIHSRVRRLVAPAEPRTLGATAWRGSCAGLVGGWGEIWGNGMFAGVTPAGRHRTNWYVAVGDRLRVDSLEALHAALDGWPAEIVKAVSATDPGDVLRHGLFDLPPLPTYVRDRVALVGDAAHAMAPSLGQGACQAITDALRLAECLADGRDVPAALAAYDRSQRPAGERLVRGSRRLLRVQLAPGTAPVRDAVLRVARPLAPR